MKVIDNISERNQGHQIVSMMENNTDEHPVGRAFQWRLNRNRMEIRVKPEGYEGSDRVIVDFEVDLVTRRKTKDRLKRYFITEKERLEWIGQFMLRNTGLVVTEVETINIVSPIERQGKTFCKPGARFIGRAVVTDKNLLNQAMLNGIGDAKAFGYGMLIIKE